MDYGALVSIRGVCRVNIKNLLQVRTIRFVNLNCSFDVDAHSLFEYLRTSINTQ